MIEKAGYVAGYGKKTVSQVSINRPKKSVAVVPKKSVNTVKPARTLVTITDSKPIDNGPI
jgi:hypothetical protein